MRVQKRGSGQLAVDHTAFAATANTADTQRKPWKTSAEHITTPTEPDIKASNV